MKKWVCGTVWRALAWSGAQQTVSAHGWTLVPLSQWPKNNCEKVNQRLRRNGEIQCLTGTHGGLLVWHVERDHRIWSCRKPRSARLNQRHLWTTCPRTATVPQKSPLFNCTRTYLTPGCQCGCRCTAPVQSVQFSPAPTSKDAYTTFWKGRLAGSASCITSQCECFYFHYHPDPWGIQGYNYNCKILIKQGANYACRASQYKELLILWIWERCCTDIAAQPEVPLGLL